MDPPSSPTEFCTISDRRYLPRVLALHDSLAAVCAAFRLHVLAMDDATADGIARLALPSLDVFPIERIEAEFPALRPVRAQRTLTEYCWTVKPFLIATLLAKQPKEAVLTYLDGDLAFWSGLDPIADDLGDGSVLLVPHGYSSSWRDVEIERGIYNAGLIAFRNDAQATDALDWWKERCLHWCFDRVEPGLFADQKYLDELEQRFASIRVCRRPEVGLAPWNVESLELLASSDGVTVEGRPLVVSHHHGLRLFRGIRVVRRLGFGAESFRWTGGSEGLAWQVWFPLTAREVDLVWEPYLRRVSAALARLRRVGFDTRAALEPVGLRVPIRMLVLEPTPLARPLASVLRPALALSRRRT